MNDLTQGSIARHLLAMAAPIAIGMLVQTLYFLVDLYFVGRLGDAALAGVSAAGNLMFIVLALTQMLGVGTVALIAQAVGRKDRDEANRVFNQSLALSALCGGLVLAGAYMLAPAYLRAVGAEGETLAQGLAYLRWFAPGLALQFASNVMASALRGTGVAKPTMVVQMLTVLINIALAPLLIAGWGTGLALGTAGAGLASSIAVAAGVLVLARYFHRLERHVGFERRQMRPRWVVWRHLLRIGFPAGGEYACMFLYMVVLYAVISGFGAAAMAGVGLGSRIMQAIFLPGMAIALAVAPIAGQNAGAGLEGRVRQTIRTALCLETAVMAGLTLVCQIRPEWFVRGFTGEAGVAAVAAQFLHIISWNFVASGIIFACSGLFQALGNTWPALLSTATRLFSFALPALWLSRQPGFALEQVWYLSVATMAVQAVTSLGLLRWQLRRRPNRPEARPLAVAEAQS